MVDYFEAGVASGSSLFTILWVLIFYKFYSGFNWEEAPDKSATNTYRSVPTTMVIQSK